jgi:O-antigen ligase
MPFAHLPGYAGGILAAPSLMQRRCREAGGSVLLPLFAIIIYYAIRSVFLESPVSGLREIPDVLLSWILPFVAGISIARKREELFRIYTGAWIILIAASVAAGAGIFPDTLTIGKELWDEGMIWALHHHNDFASCMVIILPVLLYKSIAGGKTGWWAVTVIVLIGLVLSGSRGYYIAFVPALLGFVLTELKQKRIRTYIISSTLAVFLILILTVPGIRTRIEWMVSVDASITSRINSLRVSGWVLSEHPLGGLGPGQLIRHAEYLDRVESEGLFIDARSGTMKHLHNVYATAAAEGGVIGLFLFMWMLIALAGKLFRGDSMSRALFWGYIGFLVGNLFDAQLMGPSAGMDFFFLAGLFIPRSDRETLPGDH